MEQPSDPAMQAKDLPLHESSVEFGLPDDGYAQQALEALAMEPPVVRAWIPPR